MVEPEARERALRDRALLERARHGDVDAFTTLLEARLETMARSAAAILGDGVEARDATQEALISIWRELPALRDADRFDAWAGTILVNACRHALRRRARVRVREIALVAEAAGGRRSAGGPGSPPAAPYLSGPEEDVAAGDALERAFERLAPDERAILVLHHLDELPLSEIAARLGIPVGTAKSRLFAARRSMGRALEREWR